MLYSQMSNPSTSYLVRYGRTMIDNLPIKCDHFTLLYLWCCFLYGFVSS